MSNTYIPKKYLLIEWPESRRVYLHPQAKFLDKNDESKNEGRDCIVPENIWEEYKNSEYIDENDERNIVIERDNNIY